MLTPWRWCAAALLLALPCAAEEVAQPSFPRLEVSGSLRLRTEHFDNFNIRRYGTDDRDDPLLTRLRLEADLLLRPDTHAFVQFQDARFFFSDFNRHDFPPKCSYENRFDLRQLFFESTNIRDTPFGLKLGRQAIHYGDNRIWGPGDWGNAGRYTWDAVKLYCHTDAVQLDFIAAEQVLYDAIRFDGNHLPFQCYGIYARLPRRKEASVDLFYVWKRDAHNNTPGESGTGDLNRHTLGAHAVGNLDTGGFGTFDYAATGAWQLGNEGEDDVRAWALIGELGYTFNRSFRPRVHAGCACASGDSNPADGRNETFDGVNGAVDRYYGRMNLFSLKNLIDYEAGISIQPAKKLKVSVDYHLFRLAESRDAWYYYNCKPQRRDATGGSGRDLGQEVDLVAKWEVPLSPTLRRGLKKLKLTAGWAYFIPGDFIEKTGTAGRASWAFAQVEALF